MSIKIQKVINILGIVKAAGHAIYEAVVKIKSTKNQDTKTDQTLLEK